MAVLAGGGGGVAVASELGRLLPHEDVVLLADHAYAPYARRSRLVVADRVGRLADELVGDGAKLVVLASAEATEDALPALRRRLAVPVLGFDGTVPHAAARARGRRVAVVCGEGCVRGPVVTGALRRQHGLAGAAVSPWAGLVEAVEAGGAEAQQRVRIAAAGAAALADAGVELAVLYCAHAASVAREVERAADGRLEVLDSATVAVERVRRYLVRAGLVARRRRAGRRVLVSTRPADAGALAGAVPRRPRREAAP